MTPSSSLLPFLLSSSLFLLLFLSSSSIKNQLHAPLPSSSPPPPSSSSYPGGSDAEGAKGDYERTSDAALTFSEGKKRKEISSALSCRSPIKQPRLFFSPRPLHLFSFPSFYFQVFSSPAASTSVFAPSFLLPVFPFFLVKHSGKTRKSTGGGRERGREPLLPFSLSLLFFFFALVSSRGEKGVRFVCAALFAWDPRHISKLRAKAFLASHFCSTNCSRVVVTFGIQSGNKFTR